MGNREVVESSPRGQDVGGLIEQLSALGVRLSAEDGELRVRAPRGALTSELRIRLAAQKAQLIARLRQPAAGAASSWPIIAPATQERNLPFPLTDIQQAYWVGRTSGMALGSVGCHGYWETDAAGLDVERLERAWQRLIDRHDMLRAIFLPTGEQQTLEEVPPFRIETVDLRGRSAAAAAAELGALRERMSHRLYAPDQWPLFDIHAARIDEQTTRLFLSIDLLILDAASIFQLMGEARRFYEDPTLELPRLDLSFRDYVIAEARLRETDEYKRNERFWLDRAAALPPAPDLPLVHNPAASAHRFVRRLEQIEAPVWRELKARAGRAGLTPAGVLCAAWAEALRVWSAAPEFTLTVTMFRRLPVHPQVNEIIGDFTSTILLECAPLSGGFEARARALQARLADDLDHSMVSGVHVMRERARMLGAIQSAGFPVVFTSTLGHQSAAEREASPVAWLGEHVYSVSQTPQVTLDLQVSNYGDGALLVLDAVDALFPAGLLDELFDGYRRLVRRLAEDDAAWQESPRHSVPLPAAALETRARVNATAAPVSSQLLHELFFERAAKHAADTAVICPRRRVSYGELLAATNRIGRQLRNEGVRPNSIVAVVMEKGWEQIAAVLGVLASGAAYLPIEPTVPADRLQYLLEHAQVRWALTQPALDERLTWPEGVRRLSIDERALDPGDVTPLDAVQAPTDLAYLIYTSGSTGLPKGVMIDHRGAVNTVLDMNRRFQVGSNDRVLALSSLGFDLSVYDIFGLLAAGGAIVFPEDARRHDPAHWSELVDAEQITIWNTVPTLMEVWVEAREKEQPAPLPLRLVLMSGDWIPVTLPERIRALAASARDRAARPPRIISLGGATEASIWSILYPIERVDPRWKSIPYGRAMVNQTFHVLDEELEPRPVWVPGMLHIGGIGLAQGYWHAEEKTKASFIVHPRTGERLYRTGDLGRFLPDGNIEFLGRQDGQVKVGGHRIELGEVEANLLRHPAVQQAAVVVRQEPGGGKRLAGFVVPTPGAGVPDLSEELRRHLFSKLPDYMVPSIILALASMPVTANAKIDRKKLVDLAGECARPSVAAAGAAPETTTERALGVVVAEILGKQTIGRFDSFFEAGCTSIELLRLASRVREKFGRNVALAELFRNPTIAALAARLDGREPPPRPAAAPAVEAVEQARPAAQHGPASPGQEQLWFAERLRPGRSTYHVHIALRMLGQIDVDALRAALVDVTRRHQALRMFFHEVDGRPFWTVRPAEETASLTVVPADAIEGEAREEDARHRAHAHARIPFDVDGGPLSRVDLVTFAPDDALLLLTQHHLVTDGWSIGVLARDLMRAYLMRAGGCAPEWTALPVEYGDLILREREWLESDPAEETRGWWRERLTGLRPLELPFRRRVAGVPGDAGDSRTFRIDAALTSELQAFAAREGTTPFATLFAVFAALLHRYSRQEDLGIGIVTANRPADDQSDTIGFLANTVVLRCDLSGDPSFSTWLARATVAATEAVERQRMPFFELTRLAENRAHQGLNPLVEACFAFENVPVPEVELPGLACRPMTETPDAGVRGTAKFDLVLVVAPAKEGFTADLQFATELFDAPAIERMIEHFTTLLAAAVRSPATRLSGLPLLTHSERRQVLVDWNANPATDASDSDIAELVEAQAAQTPDAPALVRGDEVWSYATLNRRANRLARHLRTLGVGPEARVALCAHRCPEMVAGMLAVLKAGAAYVPIEATYPAERQAFILEDSAASVVMGHQALLAALPAGARPVVYLEQACAEEDGAEFRTAAMPDSLAYVIYTSGSTGRPKGVENTRRGLMNLVRWHQRAFGVTPGDRATQIAAVGFDAAVWELWPYLTAGASVHMPSDVVRKDIGALREWLIGDRITVSFLATPLAEEMLGLPWPQNTALRFLLTGADTLRRYPAGNLPFALVNNYGPTECTVVATSGVVRHEPNPVRLPTIGRPIDGVRAYVLDDCMEPVPPGCDGELYVGGAGVARGYRNAPALTAERFVPDPFGGEAGSRLYRTGDLVRWTDSGELEFLGRADDQVKVRGFRIELGEIEARLAEHPGLADAVVLVREDEPGDKRLVAYVTAKAGSVDAEALRAHLSARLPEYMVPAAYVLLANLPLTSNGKLDRKALPAPDADAYVTRGYEAPVGEVETTLARIWAEVLKLERVGRNDNFFEVGGHSLLAVTVIERMRAAGWPVDVRALFAAPTLKGLAEAAGGGSRPVVVPPNLIPTGSTAITPDMLPLVSLSQSEIERIVATVPGGAANVQDIYPLAPLQEGILFHHLLAQEGDAYLTATLLAAPSGEQLERIVEVLQAVIDRHDILRTAVVWEGLAEPVQVVWRRAPLRVEEVRLDPAMGDIGEQLRGCYDPRHYRLDVSQAPLWRLIIAEDAPHNRWLMLRLAHHLVDDNTSIWFVLDEVHTILAGREAELPAPRPFRNFVAQARTGVSREEHEAFFTGLLGDVEEPTAPYGLMDVQGNGSRTAEASRAIDPELCRRLRAQARALGVTTASLFHVAFALLLGRASGREDVVFGTVLFGRMQGGEGADRALGVFINTLPVRIGVGEEEVGASVRQMHAQLMQLLRHEHAPLALAQRCSSVPPPAPLFTALLNYRHVRGEAARMPGTSAGQDRNGTLAGVTVLGEREGSNYPFDISVNDYGEGLSLDVQVDRSVDPQQVCASMHTALESLVAGLEADPAAPLCGLEVLPAAEWHRLLVEWNATESEYPRELCVHELFEAQARRTPYAPAVVDGARTLTYEELNRQANRVASSLRRIGIKPDDRVALCAERSLEMMAGLLGILKAGGAYVPIDPAYPSERIAYLLADAAPKAVLAQERWQASLGESSAPAVFLENSGSESDGGQDENVAPDKLGLTPAHLAYVIYTSGSTGLPKGVMVEHGNVVNLLIAHVRNCALTPGDRVLQFSSFGFDASVEEIFAPLAAGATVVLRPQELAVPDELFARFLRDARVTVAELPTAFWHQWAQTQPEVLPDGGALRLVVVGGEKAERRHFDRWRESSPSRDCQWMNTYGPTEATVYATALVVNANRELEPGEIPIGRPVMNTRIYILDQHGEPVPVGVAGELYIGGAGVARGYLNRPELTAERFLADPFSAEPRARMYRTGDLGRFRQDGQIEYLGRNDHQVKIRGFRIELGEIEARLAEHLSVREGVVLAREDSPGDKRLVAYLTSATESGIAVEALRTHLSALLPEYMVPAAYVVLAEFPLTPNGKLDRKALPAPDADAYVTRGYEPPVGEVESTVAGIWSEVLKLDRVGRNDNFFELGGHSLLAVTVISRLRAALQIDVGIKDLFASPVLAAFAQVVKGAVRSELSPITPVSREGALPLSFAQQRLWFLAQMEGVSAAYHIPVALRLSGQLDGMALQRALDRIVWRHESLRTTFQNVGGQPVQRVAPPDCGFALQKLDRSGHGEAAVELELRMREEAARGFDLERGPLIRGQLIRLAADEHLLLVTMHHIVSDGWSMGVLANELSALYASYRAGDEDPLPALAIQYADYTVWQRERLSGEVLERENAYWRHQLAGAPALLELPTDRPRPARQSFAGGEVKLELDAVLTGALKALAQRHGVTLYMVVAAGWAAVLGRLAGQEEVVIGTATANRTRPEMEALIGFFVNTLALRVAVGGSVAELLEEVKTRSLEAQEHAELPFEQVVEMLKPTRSLAHTPLFQAMFVWQSAGEGMPELAGLRLEPERISYGVAKFDVELDLGEEGERIVGGMRYATALFDRDTMERHAGYLRAALQGLAADESQAVDRIDLLSAEERRHQLVEWNAIESGNPSDLCIHELFEARAEQMPDAIAVSYDGQTLAYGELNRQANRLAHYLRGLGVGPDARVALCVERSLEMVVAVLAVLKAGGAYVPLDPAYPEERLEYMLEDSAPAALLVYLPSGAHGALRAIATGGSIPVVDLRVEASAWANESEANLDPDSLELKPQHLAYIIYTSGSTGKPKGVMVEHCNMVRLLSATHDWFQFDRHDVWTLFHSYAFDFSVWELWGALAYGGKLVVVPQLTTRSPQEFYRLLCAEGVTVLNQTPSAFRQLIAAQDSAEVGHCLRYVIFGGEALEVSTLRPWYQREGNRETNLINMYGITETTVHVTYRPLKQTDAVASGPSPIGCRIPDLTVYILDQYGEPVPVGVAGELYIGGAGVARGYLNRPELTAERFLADPFSAKPRARMYRTGDLGRFRPDGQIEYLGRNDHQVKIRGFRIELGEIEARLAEIPSVREAVVLAREDSPGDKRLIAYLTSATESGIAVEALRTYLSALLPEYMVPAAYVMLADFPLTTNGKLDQKALPAPDADAYVTRGYEPPVGEVESTVAGIWVEVLKLDRVSRNDNFFELGGHSLLAVIVISRLRAALQIDVGIKDLFASPVLAAFAQVVKGAVRSELSPITPVSREGALPLSFAQQRLWFLDQLQPGSAFYNIPTALQLDGPLDVAVLERTLNEVVRRHEGLRTRFETVDGALRQVIEAEVAVPLTMVDLAGLAEPLRDAEVRRQASAEARRPFDLATGPLLRTQVLRLGAAQHVLLVTLHHIVADGWSVGILAREVATIYEVLAAGQPSLLPALAVQYADFAAWQRDWLETGALEGQLAYWLERLGGGVPALELPADRRRPATRSDRGAVVQLTVPRETTEALKELGRTEGATLFMVLLAAFQTLLWRYTGQTDLVVGTPVAGRTRPEIEGLIGCFVNTLALRTDVSGDPTFRALVGRVKEVTLGAYAHQEAPFEWLVERLQPERDPSRTPLFQAMVVLQNTPREELQLRGVRLTPLDVDPGTSKFDLTWQVREEAGGLTATLEYSIDLFDAARMERMAGHLETLLAGAAAQPDARLSELPVLTAAEQAQLIEWNATVVEYDAERCLHELIEAQAARIPDAPALICDESVWSYGELNRRANRLVRRLHALGVGPGDRVGLTVERTPETMMALLGILKAGAAYVPLDMAYPPERLAWMVEDAGLRVVVTQHGESSEVGGMPVILMNPVSRSKGDNDAVRAAGLGACTRDTAYIIYTSGSTGKPKGVEIEHRSVVNLVTALEHAIYRHHHGQRLRVAVNAPLTFDGSVKQVVALALGHTLVLVPEEVRLDPEALLAYLEAQQVDMVDITPAQLKTVLPVANGRPIVREAVLVGGEAIDQELWQQLAASELPVFYNVYGPTECTVDSAIHRIGPGSHAGVVGGPVVNVQAYVVGAGEALLPVGVPGELVVGGAGVGRGYMGRADQTAERFVPDPFGDEAGGRLYRTGDLVRWTDRGKLEFLGRADDQVKVRGFRIEPGEIEAVLSGHSGVAASAVIVREDTPGEKRLVAYVVARDGHTVNSAELRTYLKTSLPDYMVPSAFAFLETLPLTGHGKVNRAALPAPDVPMVIPNTEVPPTPLEQALASIWAEVLRRESVGVQDNFFDLGGHSLLAARLFSLIEQRLGRRLPLGVLYRSPTIEAMAKAFSLEASRSSVLVPFAPVGDGPKFFCVHPLGGAAMVYKALADHLRPAVRVYGLQAPGVMDTEQPLRSIEAMARRYVLELRAEQPHGPYHVGGYSFGGLVAFDMATILMREGEDVATLALIDCAPPGTVPSRALDPRVVTLFARVIGVPMREEDVPELGHDETVRYVARRVAREAVGFGTEEEIAALLHRLLRLADVMRQAGQRYQPRPYPGALVLLKASGGLGETAGHFDRDGAYGWTSLVEGPLTAADVPGTHETMVLEPNVRELARTLSYYVCRDATGAQSEAERRGLELKGEPA